MAYQLNLIARKFKMTISSTKTKSMAMRGYNIQRVKIVIDDKIIEQVTEFKYLGYCISEYKSDLEDNFFKEQAKRLTPLLNIMMIIIHI
jgi:hypothetical protein